MFLAVQIMGSLLILIAFVAALSGRLPQTGLAYLSLNAVGSGVLALEALLDQQWGFLLLEGVWAAVSLHSIARRVLIR